MSKEAIVDKIISDADIKAKSFVDEQSAKADEILAEAAEQCRSYLYESQSQIARQVDDILARSKTVAELDARKLLLKKKQELIERVFDRALEMLCELDDKRMKKLLLGMLKCAEDGDVVILNERGKALIAKDVQKYAASKKLSLAISEETGDFAGGMILTGGGVDKNLTFEVEVALAKEELEALIAKEIFS